MSSYYIAENRTANIIFSSRAPNSRFSRIAFDQVIDAINVYIYDSSPATDKEINTALRAIYDIVPVKTAFINIFIANPTSFRERDGTYTYAYASRNYSIPIKNITTPSASSTKRIVPQYI